MVVEGLVLDAVSPGWYTMACLPLKLKVRVSFHWTQVGGLEEDVLRRSQPSTLHPTLTPQPPSRAPQAAEGAPARCVLTNAPDTGHDAYSDEYDLYGGGAGDGYYPDEEGGGEDGGEWGWNYDPDDEDAAYEYWS
jgi:hypothetical protein